MIELPYLQFDFLGTVISSPAVYLFHQPPEDPLALPVRIDDACIDDQVTPVLLDRRILWTPQSVLYGDCGLTVVYRQEDDKIRILEQFRKTGSLLFGWIRQSEHLRQLLSVQPVDDLVPRCKESLSSAVASRMETGGSGSGILCLYHRLQAGGGIAGASVTNPSIFPLYD